MDGLCFWIGYGNAVSVIFLRAQYACNGTPLHTVNMCPKWPHTFNPNLALTVGPYIEALTQTSV